MAYDIVLAQRIRDYFKTNQIAFKEKNMFGGLCFMVNNKLCVGVDKNRLIARVGKRYYQQALTFPYCIEFDIRKKPINGYVLITEKGISNHKELSFWVEKCCDFIRTG